MASDCCQVHGIHKMYDGFRAVIMLNRPVHKAAEYGLWLLTAQFRFAHCIDIICDLNCCLTKLVRV